MISCAWAAESLLIVTRPRFSSDSPTAIASASRSSVSLDPIDLPRADAEPGCRRHGVAGGRADRHSWPRAAVTFSVFAGSKASALTLTSRTTVPPAPTTASEMERRTSVGASGMATIATRCPFKTTGGDSGAHLLVVVISVAVQRLASIQLSSQIGHLLAVLRGLLQQSLVHRWAERHTYRNPYRQSNEDRHQRHDVVAEVDQVTSSFIQ